MNNDFINKIKKLPTGADANENRNNDDISYVGSDDTRVVLKDYQRDTPSESVDLNKEYIDFFINRKRNDSPKKLIETPIECWKIFFKTLSILKTQQFQIEKQPKQLQLFEEEFKTKDNAFVSITMKTTDISEYRDKKRIKQAIDDLQENFTEWVTSVNSKGEKVESKLSLIEKPSFTHGKIYFETSVYWLEKFIVLRKYNNYLYSLPFKLSNSKQFFFALYIEKLPENEWTKFSLETLNQMLGLDYKYPTHLAHSFLITLAANLNSFNSKSFNVKTDNQFIYIRPYLIKNVGVLESVDDSLSITEKTKFQLKTKYQIAYLKKRHQIEQHTEKHLKNLYFASSINFEILQDAYKLLKAEIKKEKKMMTDYIGNEFLAKWQPHITEVYLKTSTGKQFPNGAPHVL